MPQIQVVNLIFLLGSRASQLRKVLAPRSPALNPRARVPARPSEATSCACAAWQEALLPYFDSPAELLAADKAMHQGDLVAYNEMVSCLAPAV